MCVGLMKQAKLLELRVIEETQIIGELIMSFGKFNPAELFELQSN